MPIVLPGADGVKVIPHGFGFLSADGEWREMDFFSAVPAFTAPASVPSPK